MPFPMVVLAETPAPPNKVQHLTSNAATVVWWIFLGLVFLWFIAFMAEITLIKVKPVFMFVMVAIFVGMLVSAELAKVL